MVRERAYPAITGNRPVTMSYAQKHNMQVQSLFPTGSTTTKIISNTQTHQENTQKTNTSPVTNRIEKKVNTSKHTTALNLNFNTRPVLKMQYERQKLSENRKVTSLKTEMSQDHETVQISSLIPQEQAEEMTEIYTSYDDNLYREAKPLFNKVNNNAIFRNHIPRQSKINKMLKLIKGKALTDYHFALSARELKREQGLDPTLKVIIRYIESKMLTMTKTEQNRVIRESENYITIEGILFRVIVTADKQDCKLSLCIPQSLAPQIISQYHDSLLSCHQGVSRTFQTIKKNILHSKIV